MSTTQQSRSLRPNATSPGGGPHDPSGAHVAARTPYDILLTAMLIAFGVALNHSSVILGFNLSLADPVAILLTLTLLASRRLLIPPAPLLFFLLLSIHQLVVALFVSPRWTNTELPITTIASDYTKLAATFLCLLLGIQIVRAGRTRLVLRAYITGSVAVSSIAVASIALPTLMTVGDLFYGGFRFQGFTNDPNYFAVMTVAALAALWFDPGIRPHLRVVASAILIGGVLLSASKTGALALALLATWRLLGLRRAQKGAARPSRVMASIAALSAMAIGLLLLPGTGAGAALAEFASRTPALNRLVPLITDFDSAVGASGSERGDAWDVALAVIALSPALGVGVGTYLTVANEVTGIPMLAHNTYLQVSAEWGLILAIVFFVWLARHNFLRPLEISHRAAWAISSNALLVLLVGSLGLSLNYSRLFWVLLGATVATHLLSQATLSSCKGAAPKTLPSTSDPLDLDASHPCHPHLASREPRRHRHEHPVEAVHETHP